MRYGANNTIARESYIFTITPLLRDSTNGAVAAVAKKEFNGSSIIRSLCALPVNHNRQFFLFKCILRGNSTKTATGIVTKGALILVIA